MYNCNESVVDLGKPDLRSMRRVSWDILGGCGTIEWSETMTHDGLDVRNRILSCWRSSATACAGALVTIEVMCERLSGTSEGSGSIVGEAVLFINIWHEAALVNALPGRH